MDTVLANPVKAVITDSCSWMTKW